MNKTNNICPYGSLVWIEPKTGKTSSEYVKGTYKGTYCGARGEICSFKNFADCSLYEKKEKE